MTLRMNRADRLHARRVAALQRLGNGSRRLNTAERRAATEAETKALLKRTAKPPLITFTRKSQFLGAWSEARSLRQRGRISR